MIANSNLYYNNRDSKLSEFVNEDYFKGWVFNKSKKKWLTTSSLIGKVRLNCSTEKEILDFLVNYSFKDPELAFKFIQKQLVKKS